MQERERFFLHFVTFLFILYTCAARRWGGRAAGVNTPHGGWSLARFGVGLVRGLGWLWGCFGAGFGVAFGMALRGLGLIIARNRAGFGVAFGMAIG